MVWFNLDASSSLLMQSFLLEYSTVCYSSSLSPSTAAVGRLISASVCVHSIVKACICVDKLEEPFTDQHVTEGAESLHADLAPLVCEEDILQSFVNHGVHFLQP